MTIDLDDSQVTELRRLLNAPESAGLLHDVEQAMIDGGKASTDPGQGWYGGRTTEQFFRPLAYHLTTG